MSRSVPHRRMSLRGGHRTFLCRLPDVAFAPLAVLRTKRRCQDLLHSLGICDECAGLRMDICASTSAH
jgi:hypothetical protein